MSLSIGGENLPFTMQAEVGHMTMEDAVASGLFDMPDEPGMVRIPVTLNVRIPHSVLYPPASPSDTSPSPTDTPHAVPAAVAVGPASATTRKPSRHRTSPAASSHRPRLRPNAATSAPSWTSCTRHAAHARPMGHRSSSCRRKSGRQSAARTAAS